MKIDYDVIVIGGGASGFFTAINTAEKNPKLRIAIFEKTSKLLSKVKISGGGRCNVTNARTSPSLLTKFYPRGERKLYDVFDTFGTEDMVNWLSQRGVETIAEVDQRMFPVSNSSQTIIDCFLSQAKKYNIDIHQQSGIESFIQKEDYWQLITSSGQIYCHKLIIATGSSPAFWSILKEKGMAISPPVPSLFTFNIKDVRLEGLSGIAFPNARVKVTKSKLEESGPLLITHWGLSGPAILKLSARGALILAEMQYNFTIVVNYTTTTFDDAIDQLQKMKVDSPNKRVHNLALFDTPKRLWIQLCEYCGIPNEEVYGDLSKKQINKLSEELTQGTYPVIGKSTFKDEFVTAGGVELSEINLSTFASKKLPNLYFSGEVLNIDALTGGFNFQACWSAGWIISEHISQLKSN